MPLTCFCLSWLSSDTGLGTCLQQFKYLLASTKYKKNIKTQIQIQIKIQIPACKWKIQVQLQVVANTKLHQKYWNIWIANRIWPLSRKLSQTHISFSSYLCYFLHLHAIISSCSPQTWNNFPWEIPSDTIRSYDYELKTDTVAALCV